MNLSEYNLDAEYWKSCRENIGKNIEGNYPHSEQSQHLTATEKQAVHLALCRPWVTSAKSPKRSSSELLQITLSFLLLAGKLPLRHSGNAFQPLELKTSFTPARSNCSLKLLHCLYATSWRNFGLFAIYSLDLEKSFSNFTVPAPFYLCFPIEALTLPVL